jgi:hypothetical protein
MVQAPSISNTNQAINLSRLTMNPPPQVNYIHYLHSLFNMMLKLWSSRYIQHKASNAFVHLSIHMTYD